MVCSFNSATPNNPANSLVHKVVTLPVRTGFGFTMSKVWLYIKDTASVTRHTFSILVIHHSISRFPQPAWTVIMEVCLRAVLFSRPPRPTRISIIMTCLDQRNHLTPWSKASTAHGKSITHQETDSSLYFRVADVAAIGFASMSFIHEAAPGMSTCCLQQD